MTENTDAEDAAQDDESQEADIHERLDALEEGIEATKQKTAELHERNDRLRELVKKWKAEAEWFTDTSAAYYTEKCADELETVLKGDDDV